MQKAHSDLVLHFLSFVTQQSMLDTTTKCVISRLDNTQHRLVIARLQVVERAFTEKGWTLHGLKGARHRAVTLLNACAPCELTDSAHGDYRQPRVICWHLSYYSYLLLIAIVNHRENLEAIIGLFSSVLVSSVMCLVLWILCDVVVLYLYEWSDLSLIHYVNWLSSKWGH